MRRGLSEVLLSSFRNGQLRWLARQGAKYFLIPLGMRLKSGNAMAGPMMGGIFVTYRCNSVCGMCDLSSRHFGSEMSTSQIMAVIDDMVRTGVSGIGFTGGEPLLRDDIFEMIARVKFHGLPVTLNTNGILLNRDDVRGRLVDASPTNINISLDGDDADSHDSLRGGKGNFEKTVRGALALARDLKSSGSSSTLTAVTVVSRQNADRIEAIARVAADIGFHRIGFMPLHEIAPGRCSVAEDTALAGISARILAISRLPLENSPKYIEAIELAFAGQPFPVRCNAGHTSLFVDPYGRIAPCLGYFQMGKWIGDLLHSGGLVKLWNSREYAQVRREMSRCRMCYLNCQAELNFLWPEFMT